MKATELRLGNLVNTINREGEIHLPNSKVFSVQEIGFDCILCEINKIPAQERTLPIFAVRDLCPIPLTSEWIENFGFSKGFKGCSYLNLPGDGGQLLPFFYVNNRMEVEYVQFMDAKEENEIKRVHFVHQLQNLYFALTGEELTIKEETI